MISQARRVAIAAAMFLSVAPGLPAAAGDCTGIVVDVRPLAQYNHAQGTGYLAVRTGPGSDFAQLGELYRGDEVAVWNRRGNWYEVQCMSGQCTAPLWGQAMPHGWVYGRYLRVGGVCP